ncbi:MAG TPA: acetolactate decarboxylase [Candidatus Omnitrophota bacterium]|nr:acetolactate decarboxylase [Candidatus Omnitrophota bacterium]HOX09489.1 acetolactate decarboxylase [Candidatus Omnitrophota bacterium]HRZ67142.1 acetolactate decarboxylase [Candidatus Omnitrophota bacterium]
MKNLICLLSVVMISAAAAGCSNSGGDRDVLFQVSTLNALSGGIYDGDTDFNELKKRGDFGIGTFNALDGEMLAVDGEFFQVKSDGLAYPVSGIAKTPFSAVTFFETDKLICVDKPMEMEQLQGYIDTLLPTKNIFYAVKIEGLFDYVKTRSVPPQKKPYAPLSEAVKGQSVFELKEIKGTVVGFRCPGYAAGFNLPGYHMHFITEGRNTGGHLLDFRVKRAVVELDYTERYSVSLPGDKEFYSAVLEDGVGDALEKAERQ